MVNSLTGKPITLSFTPISINCCNCSAFSFSNRSLSSNALLKSSGTSPYSAINFLLVVSLSIGFRPCPPLRTFAFVVCSFNFSSSSITFSLSLTISLTILPTIFLLCLLCFSLSRFNNAVFLCSLSNAFCCIANSFAFFVALSNELSTISVNTSFTKFFFCVFSNSSRSFLIRSISFCLSLICRNSFISSGVGTFFTGGFGNGRSGLGVLGNGRFPRINNGTSTSAGFGGTRGSFSITSLNSVSSNSSINCFPVSAISSCVSMISLILSSCDKSLNLLSSTCSPLISISPPRINSSTFSNTSTFGNSFCLETFALFISNGITSSSFSLLSLINLFSFASSFRSAFLCFRSDLLTDLLIIPSNILSTALSLSCLCLKNSSFSLCSFKNSFRFCFSCSRFCCLCSSFLDFVVCENKLNLVLSFSFTNSFCCLSSFSSFTCLSVGKSKPKFVWFL